MIRLTEAARQLAPSFRETMSYSGCEFTVLPHPTGSGIRVMVRRLGRQDLSADVASEDDFAQFELLRRELRPGDRYRLDLLLRKYVDRSGAPADPAVEVVRFADVRVPEIRRAITKLANKLRPPLSVIAFILILAIAYICVIVYPGWRIGSISSSYNLIDDPGQRSMLISQIEAEEQAIRTGAQLFGGALVLATLLVTYKRTVAFERQIQAQSSAADRSARISESGQVTDRFAKAIELLASEKEEMFIGGVHLLERIAKDSPRDHLTVVEVLVSYLQGSFSTKSKNSPRRRRANQVRAQAVMKVLGRRLDGIETERHARGERSTFHLDLSSLDLRGIEVIGGYFKAADFSESNLSHAILRGCHLESAKFRDAKLAFADLRYAHFGKFVDTEHGSTHTSGPAPLRNTDLRAADLFGAHDLTQEQLVGAIIDNRTNAPTTIRPDWWGNLIGASLPSKRRGSRSKKKPKPSL